MCIIKDKYSLDYNDIYIIFEIMSDYEFINSDSVNKLAEFVDKCIFCYSKYYYYTSNPLKSYYRKNVERLYYICA